MASSEPQEINTWPQISQQVDGRATSLNDMRPMSNGFTDDMQFPMSFPNSFDESFELACDPYSTTATNYGNANGNDAMSTQHLAPPTPSTPMGRFLHQEQQDPWTSTRLQPPSTQFPQTAAFQTPRTPTKSLDTTSTAPGRPRADSAYFSANAYSASGTEPLQLGQECHDVADRLKNLKAPSRSRRTASTSGSASAVRKSSRRSNDETLSGQSLHCPRLDCDDTFRVASELKKHILKHDKPFRCHEPGCTRKEGFTSSNDLDRHRKTKHGLGPDDKVYRCPSVNCHEPDKKWPRWDNFKQHVQRMHKDEDTDSLLERAELFVNSANLGRPSVTFEMQSTQMPDTISWHTPSDVGSNYSHLPGQSFHLSARPTDLPFASIPEIDFAQSTSFSGGSVMNTGLQPELPWAEQGSCYNSFYERASAPGDLQAVSPLNSFYERASAPGDLQAMSPLGSAADDAQHSVPKAAPLRGKQRKRMPKAPAIVLNDGNVKRQDQDLAHMIAAKVGEEHEQTIRALLEENREDGVVEGRDPLIAAEQPVRWKQMQKRWPEVRAKEICQSRARGGLGPHHSSANERHGSTGFRHGRPASIAGGETLGDQSGGRFATFRGRPCTKCNKIVARPCDLKKHDDRHERRWGCTFDGCPKKFGSKHDWKRHERFQHWPEEAWRCGLEMQRGGHRETCAAYRNNEADFKSHLREAHKSVAKSEEQVEEYSSMYHIRANFVANFWCGFCKEIVTLSIEGAHGDKGLTERADHIDNHFKREQRRIEEWVLCSVNKTKGQMQEDVEGVWAASEQDGSVDDIPDGCGLEADPLPMHANIGLTGDGGQVQQEAAPRRGRLGKRHCDSQDESVYCCNCGDGPYGNLNTPCADCGHWCEWCLEGSKRGKV